MTRARRSIFATLLLWTAAAGLVAFAGRATLDVETTHGTVASVDHRGGTFTVQPDPGRGDAVTLHVDEHTKFVRDGGEIPFEDLAVDATVTVNYEQRPDGRFVALTVGVG